MWSIDPWREMERMRREMDRLFGRFGIPTAAYQFPLTNLYENKDEFTLIAELPGVTKENVAINYHDGSLTITGKRTLSDYGKNVNILRREQPEGEFARTIRVPAKVKEQEIRATFQDGILRIVLPKAEEAKPKQISVQD